MWIDFSSIEAANQNWEQLVRLVYGKPVYKKPPLGSPPSYLTESPASPASPLLAKFATLRKSLISGSRLVRAARQDFVAACLGFAEPYRTKQYSQLDQRNLMEQLLKDSEELKVLRNSIVDWTLLESGLEGNAEFSEPLLLFLEQLLEVGSRPPDVVRWSENWFEALKVMVYETFLYIVAALLKNRAYTLLGEVLSSSYIKPYSDRYGNSDFGRIELFFHSSEFFQQALAPANTRLHSPTAELIKRQADRTDLPLESLIEADLVVFLKAITSREFRWYPQTLIYANNRDFPFLVRAAQRRNFKNLATIIGVSDSASLKARANEGYKESGITNLTIFYMFSRTPWESLRVDTYDTV